MVGIYHEQCETFATLSILTDNYKLHYMIFNMREFTMPKGVYTCVLFCLALLCWVTSCAAQWASSNPTSRPKGACGSIDIRNNVNNFARLENCTVIEGQLHILLIDYAQTEDYESLHFPDLVEITDHLLLYRVSKLKTLRNIFPNLAVIKGQNLFTNYALAAFEMQDLEELGLIGLTTIAKGSVRLEKNPKLCYIETIDWTKIVQPSYVPDNFLKGNKDIKECVNTCQGSCETTMGFSRQERRCWTLHDCQTMLSCPSVCETGLCNGTQCCDKSCLGGCTGPGPRNCKVCKDVIQYQETRQPVCAERCDPGTYKYVDRRCLLARQCLNFTDYQLPSRTTLKLVMEPYKAGLCVDECPPLYKKDYDDPTKCVRCQGKCPRLCVGKIVNSIDSAHELKGCTKIMGPLEINIMGGSHIGKELEDNLAQIEEVTGFIRIFHSYALLSLNFLRGLRKIGGEKLYLNRYSLAVFNNVNIQELFLDHQNITLVKGTVWFQSNRKLCYKKIMQFVTDIGHLDKIRVDDISRETNGDQMPCEIQKLNFTVLNVTPHIAILNWTNFKIQDRRHLLSYTVNYKEAPEKNVSLYQGRDACSDEIWKTTDMPLEGDDDAPWIHGYLTNLKPWTQYAAYVETLTISKSTQGAISDVIYFRTRADVPTSPTKLHVVAEQHGELHIMWEPPAEPNGNISHYEVYWQLRNLDALSYENRDYCSYPLSEDQEKQEQEQEEKEEREREKTSDQCCACPMSKQQLAEQERERNMEIVFQDILLNEVYIKRLSKPYTTLQPTKKRIRQRRILQHKAKTQGNDTDSIKHERNKYNYSPVSSKIMNIPSTDKVVRSTTTEANNITVNIVIEPNITTSPKTTAAPPPKENSYYMALVYEKQEMYLPNLGHFEDYSIEVIACQTKDPRHPDKHVLCSHRAISSGRTLPNPLEDAVNSTLVMASLQKNRTGAIHIRWQDPPNPNGIIVTYEIEYRKTNVQNVKPILICITYKMYRDQGKNGHFLDKLDHGNYTFRIRATSLSANGSWTEYMYFTIPETSMEKLSQEAVVFIVMAIVIVVLLATGMGVWFVAKKKFGRDTHDTIHISANPDYAPDYFVYEPDEWEVDRDKVELLRELGQGSFGMVYEGRVKNVVSGVENMSVAIKTTNNASSDYDRYMFLQEASRMKSFQTHHVVKLIGVVSKDQPALVLMELMEGGDLKNFLRMHRPDEEDNNGRQPPTLKQIMQIASEIADGMAYLADKKFVHRDLAARNCMVGRDMTVKIGDFGMTRDIYETDYYRKGTRGLLPVRWMGPESLKDGVFTSASDVWSFGVVLWEMATLAAQPYQGLSNEEVLRYVQSGKIMDTPERCPTKLYDLMMKCWRFRPKNRPTFKEVIEILLPDLDKRFKELSYFFSEENTKYEEAQRASAQNHKNDRLGDMLDDIDADDDDHIGDASPMNDYVDEATMPFLGSAASNGHPSVELDDIFTDTGSYPWQPKNRPVGETCDCSRFNEIDEGAAAQSLDCNRQSVCSSPNSAIGGSSDGSKGSSKSSNSSYAHMNGLSVANGHVPVHVVRTTPC